LVITEECADSRTFPAWHFAEVTIGDERRIVAISTVETPTGPVPFWYDDPEHPDRLMPLLASMNPVNLGDYATFIHRDDNMSLFVSLCKAIEDLPEPMYAVQAIDWIRRRGVLNEANQKMVAKQALNAVEQATRKRRGEFDRLLFQLCGPG
jgi:hypothetical protein